MRLSGRRCPSPRPVVLAWLLLAVAAAPVWSRADLTRAFLTGDALLRAPVPNEAFTAPHDARLPDTEFHGRLTFVVRPSNLRIRILREALGIGRDARAPFPALPPFDVELSQVDGRLVPARRGPIPHARGTHEWSVGPGRVWSEPGDGDAARASVPVALVEKNANCVHNGLLTFLFDRQGKVERVAMQIVQETCSYFQFDLAGTAEAATSPLPDGLAAQIAARWRAESANRLPVRPIEALRETAPAVDPAGFGASAEVSPGAMSSFGVVWRGVHYVSGCATRFGPYPYCDELLLPSYSVAKSVVAGLALMRMELLEPGIRHAKLVDLVPACAQEGEWEGVTLDHLLDMTTGRYRSVLREADENDMPASGFFNVLTHEEKLQIACTRFPRRESPGLRWVYHTSDTYLLGTALTAAWRRHHPGGDWYRELLGRPLWNRLGLSPEAGFTRRTTDSEAQPFAGWGLTLLRDDVAKLAVFINAGTGASAGARLVDATELQSALQRRPEDPGLTAAAPDLRYQNGFWAWNAAQALQCPRDLWIPFMSGFGGISVVLLPNGAVYYYFSDGSEFRFARAVRTASQLAPLCQAAP